MVETILGVQFDPIRAFTNGHLGAFWARIRGSSQAGERWTKVTDAAPLPMTFERFDDEHPWMDVGIALQVSRDPPANRLQISNESGNALIQIQNGRIHYNWVRQHDGVYVRYENVRPRFEAILAELGSYLKEQGLGDIKPNQWEVTYVNHMPKGTVWDAPGDWADVFVGLAPSGFGASESRFESFAGVWHYEIPEKRGRLHVELARARTQAAPREELLRFTLTARGPISPGTLNGGELVNGLDLGRRAIVTGFRDLTSKRAHAYWKLES